MPAPAALPITFGAPAVLYGLIAAAAPILIHFLLRPRPRRQPFPAIRFVLESHQAAERTQRLRRLLLLIMRMAAIAGLALLLAQPRLKAARWAPAGTGPVSVVLCIDDSASMGYRFEGRTRLDVAREWALALLEDYRRFGHGSEFAMLTGTDLIQTPSGRSMEAVLTGGRNLVAARIRSLSQGSHDRPMTAMLRRADELLTQARHPRREIYCFSDLTARAWRDLPPGNDPIAPASGAAVFVIDVGPPEVANTSLILSHVPRRPVPPNVPVRIDASVQVTGTIPTSDLEIEIRVDDQPRLRQPVTMPGDGSGTVNASLVLPGLPAGTRRITLELTPGDPLPCDNVRYAALEVGELPRVVVVGRFEKADSAASLVSTMLAPPSLPEDKQRVTVIRLAPEDLGAPDVAGARAVFLADAAALSESGWKSLTEYVRAGGLLVTVLGPSVTPAGYVAGRDVLPGLPAQIRTFEPAAQLAPIDLKHPLLTPFASPGVDPITDRSVFKAWTIEKVEGPSTVLCPLTDGAPALLQRSIGTGTSLMLTFSPQRDWSEFAARAAPMILLWHTAVDLGGGGPDPSLRAGQTATIPIGSHPDVRAVEVRWGPSDPRPRRMTVPPDGRLEIPVDAAGHLIITRPGPAAEVLQVRAVNVAEEESDLRRLDRGDILARFSSGTATAAANPSELGQVQRRQRAGLDATVVVALGLLALLVAESGFANRFYRRTTAPAARP